MAFRKDDYFFIKQITIIFLITVCNCYSDYDEILPKKKIRTRNFTEMVQMEYYVDKSLFIKHFLLDSKYKNILITRPRSFGKSINLDMLRTYLEIETNENGTQLSKGETEKLFKKLKIKNFDKKSSYLGQYPVIYVNFKNVIAIYGKEIYKSIKISIKNEFIRHSYLKNSKFINDDDKKNIKMYIEGNFGDVMLRNSLQFFSRMLKIHFNKTVFILIDEYNIPVNNAFFNGSCENNREKITQECQKQRYIVTGVLREILKNGLKENDENLERGLIMGTTYLAKEEIFSTLNNLKLETVLNKSYTNDFGFTENEVTSLLKKLGKSDFKEETKVLYNGYQYDDKVDSLYNPESMVNYLHLNRTGHYWIFKGAPQILKDIFIIHVATLWHDLLKLMNGEVLSKSLSYNNSKFLSENSEQFYVEAVNYGYLVARKTSKVSYDVKIPNLEVVKIFTDVILNWFNGIRYGKSSMVKKIGKLYFQALKTKDFEKVTGELEKYFVDFMNPFITNKLEEKLKIRIEAFFEYLLILSLRSVPNSINYNITSGNISRYIFYEAGNLAGVKINVGIVPVRKIDTEAYILEWTFTLSDPHAINLKQHNKIVDMPFAKHKQFFNSKDHPHLKNCTVIKATGYTAQTMRKIISNILISWETRLIEKLP